MRLRLLAVAASASAMTFHQHGRRALLAGGVGAALTTALSFSYPTVAAGAEPEKPKFRRLQQIQFIAALGDPQAASGTGADKWGLWREDPGPRGVGLRDGYEKLVSAGGRAPAGWTFSSADWWLEEHGLIMEQPEALPVRKYVREGETLRTVERFQRYVVTGDREVTSVLTVHEDGRWELSKGKLYDVTHLPCRSARYTPTTGGGACTPAQADRAQFPVRPGAAMPSVSGCAKQDYAVLFVVGVAV